MTGWGEISFRAKASGPAAGRRGGSWFFVVKNNFCPTLDAPTGVLGQQKSPKSDSQVAKDIHIMMMVVFSKYKESPTQNKDGGF